MSDNSPTGPQVPDHESLYRAITRPEQWVPGRENSVSTAAFKRSIFSVDIASLTTPNKTIERIDKRKEGVGLAEFSCGESRQLGFDARKELDVNYPDNDAHANVYAPKGSGQRSRNAKKLSLLCKVVVEPSFFIG